MSNHKCLEKDGFEIIMFGYPHVVWRCHTCYSVTRIVPVDDVEDKYIELAYHMIDTYRKARGKS